MEACRASSAQRNPCGCPTLIWLQTSQGEARVDLAACQLRPCLHYDRGHLQARRPGLPPTSGRALPSSLLRRALSCSARRLTWLLSLFRPPRCWNPQGDLITLKVNKLMSVKNLPYEYYSLPYCRPEKIVSSAENLGEVLRGDRIENSPYTVSAAGLGAGVTPWAARQCSTPDNCAVR